jgi:hypothetical protein
VKGGRIKNCLTCKRFKKDLSNCPRIDKRILRKVARKGDFKRCKYYKYDKQRELRLRWDKQ